MSEIKIKLWFLLLIVSTGFLVFGRQAAGAEAYYINNNRVLLYKVINWWYDCPPEASGQLCGQILTYRNSGSAKVEYDKDNRMVKLIVPRSFAKIVSLFGSHSRQENSRRFTCTFREKDILGTGQSMDVTDVFTSDGTIYLKGIAPARVQTIQQIRAAIVFEITGSICGLMDGKISLSPDNDFIKSCSFPSQNKGSLLPVTLRLYHAETNQTLLIYSGLN